ncbi:MAG: type II secretion system ATPase GspE [Gammaproteobacteria bacterium]|nr:type II secretion system ATPase GspE [Gammaproteobacteria bacterium]
MLANPKKFQAAPTGRDVIAYLIELGKLVEGDAQSKFGSDTASVKGVGPQLVRLGMISDRDLAAAYAEVYNLPLLAETEIPVASADRGEISLRFLKESRMVPLGRAGERLLLAVADPEDSFSLHAIRLATGLEPELRIATLSRIEELLNRFYGDGQSAMENLVEEIESGDGAAQAGSGEHALDFAADAPVVRLVNLILNRALELRASDIHIEPFENELKVRYRIDGVLQGAESPPVRSAVKVISLVKLMAKMNIAERRLPQDGRIQLRAQGKLVDLRVATIPTVHGESLALRILDKESVALDLDTLGFEAEIAAQLKHGLSASHGIILVTGPTGSGKTTTLYAALEILNTPERKIFTVEDPVEYQLPGINQIQVKPKIGLSFANALRAIVRQDPDIIMIGEMRDLETARIAVQSALTGHLVFSTLHTNDAGSSVTRLLDMGVEDYLLTSTLNSILAQRLVRTLCTVCREPYQPVPALIRELELDQHGAGETLTLYRAQGCATCAGTGYLGRTVISELLVLSEALRRLILSRADGATIQQAAIAAGMLPMKADGLRKALRGITTIEEVTRVTQE